ncbi:hypothetical protein O181_097107 [Austropuccinia psidii MF-1]|uniref:Uncharacterized protein n=1 Tax=Austropuccinia psidii MF-1 TaxID=1389203 RepID=A0A9Q3PE65_9BASI|nr:hypothetical protein [Austropuccinia psidii MF-1]
MKDGNGKRTFKLGPIVTMSCHPWDSNAKNKANGFHRNKTLPFLVCLARKLRGNQPQAPVAPNEPSQTIEPPIPGPSPSSKPHEDVPTHEPEPEVALTPSMEEPFDSPSLHSYPSSFPSAPKTPVPSPPHSHNEACQEFTELQPLLMIPQAIVHESINQILLQHHQLLHMIPFVNVTHRNEMHREFQEELNSLLAQSLEAYPKGDITGIVSKYLAI